jgi:hypothetical protein
MHIFHQKQMKSPSKIFFDSLQQRLLSLFHQSYSDPRLEMPLRKDKLVQDRIMHYRNRCLCRVPEALGKALKTLGKGSVECRIRQRRLGIQCIGKAFFAEYFFSGTRQRDVSSARQHSTKKSSRYGAG